MDLTFDPAQLVGLVLAITRTGAFAAASPMTKALPVPGRIAFALAVGLATARPAEGAEVLSGFVVMVAVNVGVGLVLGFLTGLVIVAFEVAGSVIDITSGLNASQVFDPVTGSHNSVFGRAFTLTAITLWFVMGGDRLAVEALSATVVAIPLDGTISLSPGLADVAVRLVAEMLWSALQLALPTLAALFVTEVAFGVAARFAPQTNVFAIGLPAKLVAAMATVGLVIAGFPTAMDGSMATAREIVITTIRGLGG